MFQDLTQNIDKWEKESKNKQSQLIKEYNANLERLNKADRLMAQSELSQATLDKWLDECCRIMEKQNEILSRLDNDLYKDDSGFLYQDIPPLQNKEGFSFFRGDLEALLDENIPDHRFLLPYYAFEVRQKHWKMAGVRRVIVILKGCTQVFTGDVVFTRQELIEALTIAGSEGIDTVIDLISSKKVFGNGIRLAVDGPAF